MGVGGLDARFDLTPIGFGLGVGLPRARRVGKDEGGTLAHKLDAQLLKFSARHSFAVEDNSFSIDPDVERSLGVFPRSPEVQRHPDDLKNSRTGSPTSIETARCRPRQTKMAFPIDEQQSACTCSAPAAWASSQKLPSFNSDQQTNDVKKSVPGAAAAWSRRPAANHDDHHGADSGPPAPPYGPRQSAAEPAPLTQVCVFVSCDFNAPDLPSPVWYGLPAASARSNGCVRAPRCCEEPSGERELVIGEERAHSIMVYTNGQPYEKHREGPSR